MYVSWSFIYTTCFKLFIYEKYSHYRNHWSRWDFLTSEILKNQPNHILYGITRQKHKDEFFNKLSTLSRIKHDRVKLLNIDLGNFHKVNDLINELKPESIYNLSGPSSVYDSFKNPVESKFSIKNIFDNLTNSVIKSGIYSNFYQASSSEMFGVNITTELDENSTFSPNSPYAEAKLRNHKSFGSFAKI